MISELTAQAVEGDRDAVTAIRDLFRAGLGGAEIVGTVEEMTAAVDAVIELGDRWRDGDDDTPFDDGFPAPWPRRDRDAYIQLVESLTFVDPPKPKKAAARKSTDESDGQ